MSFTLPIPVYPAALRSHTAALLAEGAKTVRYLRQTSHSPCGICGRKGQPHPLFPVPCRETLHFIHAYVDLTSRSIHFLGSCPVLFFPNEYAIKHCKEQEAISSPALKAQPQSSAVRRAFSVSSQASQRCRPIPSARLLNPFLQSPDLLSAGSLIK